MTNEFSGVRTWARVGACLASLLIAGTIVSCSRTSGSEPQPRSLARLNLPGLGALDLQAMGERTHDVGAKILLDAGSHQYEHDLSVPPPHWGKYELVSLEWRNMDLARGALLVQLSLGEVGSYNLFRETWCTVLLLSREMAPIEVVSEGSASDEVGTLQNRTSEGYSLRYESAMGSVEVIDAADQKVVWRSAP